MRNIALIFISVFAFLFSSLGFALEARVDRTSVPENETFQLDISGTFSAFNLRIDLSPLEKDFRVLDKHRSSNMNYINGDFSAQTTLTVTLEPKRAGTFTIPSITIEGESTKTIDIQVTKAAKNAISENSNQAPPIDIDVSIDTTETWVQAQMLLTIQLYQSVQLFNLELLGVKELQQLGLSIQKIGDNKSFQSKRNNITYQVTELNYVLFSDNPGTFQLPEFVFEGQMPLRNSRYGKRLEVSAEPITITVKDVPKNYPSATWIPAKDLQITDDLENEITLEVGDSLNRNLILSVYGQEAAVIPNLPKAESDFVNIYGDAPELNNQLTKDGVTGIRMDNVAIISRKPGTFILPAIEIPWFNTKTAKTEYAKLPERIIKINGPIQQDNQSSSVPLNTASIEIQQTEPSSPTALEKTDQHSALTEDKDASQNSLPFWALMLLILLTLAVVVQSIFIWRFTQRNTLPSKTQQNDAPKIISGWDQPLPEDFVSSFRLIQKALQKHHLSLADLPEQAQSLIDQFRMNNYGSAFSDAPFTNDEREQLRLLLKTFFDSRNTTSKGPKLYPS